MRKKNRIIIVTECVYSGILRAIIEDVKIIKSLGYSITFVLPKKFRDRYGESGDKNIIFLKEFGDIEYINLRRKLRYLISDTFGLSKYLKDKSDYLLFSYSGYAGKLSRILYFFDKKKNVIHIPQCIDIIRRRGSEKYFDLFFEKFFANQSAGYLACGSSEIDTLINTYRVPSHKVHLNPNSVKQQYTKRSILDRSSFTYEYVILGRLVKDKGAHILLKALNSFDLLDKTIVIGDGELLEELRHIYNKATFTGNIPNDQALKYLSKSKYILSASIIEGLPFSILEAMSLGVVPIISNVKGHKDIITQGITGFLFSNDTELYDLILQTQLWSPEIYKDISRRAFEATQSLYSLKQNNLKNFLLQYGS